MEQTPYSPQGDKNLEALDQAAPNFINWVYAQIQPYLQGTILEIGSGRGTYSKKVATQFPHSRLFFSELDQHYVAELKRNFAEERVTITPLDIEAGIGELAPGSVDTAFALNVFEHIHDDGAAFHHVHRLLSKGGCFILLVPAHPRLYNVIDASIGHFRRYTKKDVAERARTAGFVIEKIYFFNFFSIVGWWWNGVVLRQAAISPAILSLFDKMVPVLRFVEKYILRRTVGISLVAILRKP